MNKYLKTSLLLLIASSQAHAIQYQKKQRNTFKSEYEMIPSFNLLDQGSSYFDVSYSYNSTPVARRYKGSILPVAAGLHETSFNYSSSLGESLDFGVMLPIHTLVAKSENSNNYTSYLSGLLGELRYQPFKGFAITLSTQSPALPGGTVSAVDPTSMKYSLPKEGQKGIYGAKVSGKVFETESLSSTAYGAYFMAPGDSVYGIDHSSIMQVGSGLTYNFKDKKEGSFVSIEHIYQKTPSDSNSQSLLSFGKRGNDNTYSVFLGTSDLGKSETNRFQAGLTISFGSSKRTQKDITGGAYNASGEFNMGGSSGFVPSKAPSEFKNQKLNEPKDQEVPKQEEMNPSSEESPKEEVTQEEASKEKTTQEETAKEEAPKEEITTKEQDVKKEESAPSETEVKGEESNSFLE